MEVMLEMMRILEARYSLALVRVNTRDKSFVNLQKHRANSKVYCSASVLIEDRVARHFLIADR
jgi:hypothetical protein